MESFLLCLQDAEVRCTLIKVQHTIDDDDPEPDDEDFTRTIERFVAEVRGSAEIPDHSVEVYLGVWGGQMTFTVPQSFFDLVHERRWPVTFDLND